MGTFSNYPGDPPDEDTPCAVCGLGDDCICPECPQCGSQGDPYCYKDHGMILSQEQIDSLAKQEKTWQEDAEVFNDFDRPCDFY